jgi:nucleolar protein 56
MRLKEWFSWHFPELARIVTDNTLYTKSVDLIKSRDNVTDDIKEALNVVLLDEEKTQ